jgi:hypothetical protein
MLPWGWSTSADADATGPVLLALAPYAAQKEVRTALDRALALLPGLCDSTGAVASAWGTGACSTGVLLPGVAALGETTGSYAAGLALLYQPGKRFAAYDGDTLSDEQGFRGLAAAAGASAGAYRLYDFSGTALTAARASAPTYCPVRFSVVPDGAAVTVSAGGQSVSPVGGIYDLPAGEYTYAVSRDGFVTRTGSVSVTAADAAGHTEKVLSVSLTSKPSQGGESLRVQVRVEMHPAGGAEGTYTYRHDASAYTALAARSVTLSRGSTVFDALDASGAAYHEKSWGYIDSIGGVEERQYGPNSGWMFLLNGTAGTESCRTARLSDGDQVVWFYTDDYTRDYGSESWSSASGTGSAGTVITVTAASPAVTARQAAQAAAALPASGGSITVSAPGCTAVSLPVKTAGELAAKTGAGWTAVLSGGRVTLPAKALQALAAQASGDELTLFVHKESASVFQVKLTCGGREIKDLGAAALTAELPADGDFSGARNCRVAVRTASGRTSFVIGSVESIGGAAFVCLSLTQSAQVTITGEALGAAPFPDTAGHWAEPSVNAIFARGVLGGVSLTAFGPDRPMTRAMAVTALWRLAGEPAAPADGDFSDLTGAWCAAAARWARAQGVANGYGDGSFRPDAAVARQELAAMLCRYAGAPAAGGKLAFADAGTAAPWALPALTWAVSEGYLTGVTPAELDPRGQVTRAQAAVILERFCEKTA